MLDAGIVLFASAATVILLGGATKLSIAGVQILLLNPVRPAIWAAGLIALRLWIGRGLNPLPAIPAPRIASRLAAERSRFGSMPPIPPGFGTYLAAVALASIVMFAPQVLHIRQVPDPGDPIFSAWRLARFAHQLIHDPRHLFDGNIFYPERLTLTYSDATILQGLLATPFILAGADPLIVSNALFLAAFPLCGMAFFYAAWRLTGDPRASFVAGLLGALYPFHTEHYSHLELQYFFFVPLAMVALLDLLAAPTLRRGALLGLIVCCQWLASMYFGIMLITFLIPFGAVVALAWRVRLDRRLVGAVTLAAVAVAAALVVVGAPYMMSRQVRGDRAFALVRLSSAQPVDYTRPHARLASHDWRSRVGNTQERELFPGFAVTAFAIVGVIPPLNGVATATLVSGALALDWSFGTNGLTYDDLYRWVLPYRGMRVAARFSVFVGSALILLGAYGMVRLLRLGRGPRGEMAIFLIATGLVLMDLRPRVGLRDYWRTVPPIYAAVSSEMILAEFPFEPGVDQMYFSTAHWAQLFNGYSGFFPESFIRMARQVDAFPADPSLDALRAAGATHITVNCRL